MRGRRLSSRRGHSVWSAAVATAAAVATIAAAGVPSASGQQEGPRIVGGSATTIAAWPWQAAVTLNDNFFTGNGFQRQICGASLITSTLAVSAAHCFFDIFNPPGNGFETSAAFAAITGRTTLSNSAEGAETDLSTYYVLDGDDGGFDDWNQASAPLYNPATDVFDVAVIQLATPAAPPAATIRLAGPTETTAWSPGSPAFITGWGSTSFGGPSSDTLLQAQVHILSDQSCDGPYDYDPVSMVCAGELAGGVDACGGDSGGPLVVPIQSGGFRLVGDTSFGFLCAVPGFPGVYGRVAADPIRAAIADLAGPDVIGAAPCIVPSLRRRTVRGARGVLDRRGCTLGVVRRRHSRLRRGRIVRQAPAAGASVPRGSAVAVVVSKGPRRGG
jgi:trypsin